MDIIECINKRHSVRSFKEDPVPQDLIQELLVLGTKAASGAFEQPWGFLVIQDKEEIESLASEIKQDLLASLDTTPRPERYEKMFRSEGFNVFNHAPTLIIIYGNTGSRWYVNDCSMAAGNIMLAAYSMGLGTCWIGFAQHHFNSAEFKSKHGVSDDFDLVATLTCGYMTEDHPGPERKPPLVFGT